MRFFFAILTLFVIFSSCQKALKDVNDYLPEIQLTAVAQSDGSVKLTAKLTHPGLGSLEALGFSFSENPNASISENQILVDVLNGDEFTGTFPPGFDISKTYYFKAFATNAYGYSVSNTVSLSNIEAQPVEAPCTLSLNHFNITGATGSIYQFDPVTNSFDYIEYRQNASGGYLTFRFKTPPATGVYTTTTYENPDPGKVRVLASNLSISGVAAAGSLVYVNQISPTKFKVEVCGIPWSSGSYNGFIYTHFERNY